MEQVRTAVPVTDTGNDRRSPGDPGYDAALQRLLAKAQARDPRFRLATPAERRYGEPRDLYSFSGAGGLMVAPVFVLDPPSTP